MKKLLFLLLFSPVLFAGTIKLAWDASTTQACTATITVDCVAGYDLYYGTSPDSLTVLVDVGNVLTYTETGLLDNTRYYFAIKSYSTGHAQVSGFSNIVSTISYPDSYSQTFKSTTPPIVGNDGQPIEIGTKFTPIVNGKVYAVQVFIPAGYVGDRLVKLWHSNGTLLATATLANDNYSNGWQSIEFVTPVDVVAGQTYIASFHSSGAYSYQQSFFVNDVISSDILMPGGENGVYAYGGSQFPTNSFSSTNYFIGVVFVRDAIQVDGFSYPSGMVANYHFENNFADSSTSLNHCISNANTKPIFVQGHLGIAAKFDDDDFLTCPFNLQTNFTNEYTVSAWVKFDTLPANKRVAVSKPTIDGKDIFVLLTYRAGANQYYGFGNQIDATTRKSAIGGAALANTWQHIVGVFDQSSVKLYVDGVQVATLANTLPLMTQPLPINIGKLPCCTPGFNGYIDEVQLYNRALTSAEVSTLFFQDKN